MANWAMSVGRGAVRTNAIGFDNFKASYADIAKMKTRLRETMDNNRYFGMSAELVYAPCIYTDSDESVEGYTVLPDHSGIYTTQMRNKASEILDVLKESIQIGK